MFLVEGGVNCVFICLWFDVGNIVFMVKLVGFFFVMFEFVLVVVIMIDGWLCIYFFEGLLVCFDCGLILFILLFVVMWLLVDVMGVMVGLNVVIVKVSYDDNEEIVWISGDDFVVVWIEYWLDCLVMLYEVIFKLSGFCEWFYLICICVDGVEVYCGVMGCSFGYVMLLLKLVCG